MEKIIKIDETTFEEEIVIPAAPEVKTKVQGNLDGILADIEGTKTYIDKLEKDLVSAKANLVVLKSKRDSIKGLGIITAKEKAEKEKI